MRECRIKKADNGFLIEYEEMDDENTAIVRRIVVEDFEDDEKKNIADMLYKVADFFGVCYDKWSDKNLDINWDKKGHKLE
jgi:hypothetical protein